MQVLMINGSTNKDGETNLLLTTLKGYLRGKGIESEILHAESAVMSAKYPYCTACTNPCAKGCYKGTALEMLYDKMREASFIVFASPVYFGNMSAQLKTIFDKTRALRAEGALIGKKGCAISVGGSQYGGQGHTISGIHSSMLVEGMTIVGDGSLEFGAGNYGVLAKKPVISDEAAMGKLKSLAERIVSELR